MAPTKKSNKNNKKEEKMAVKAAATTKAPPPKSKDLSDYIKKQKYNNKFVYKMTDEELLAPAKGHPKGTRVVDVLPLGAKVDAACASRAQRVSYGLKAVEGVSRNEMNRKNLINYLEGKECKFLGLLSGGMNIILNYMYVLTSLFHTIVVPGFVKGSKEHSQYMQAKVASGEHYFTNQQLATDKAMGGSDLYRLWTMDQKKYPIIWKKVSEEDWQLWILPSKKGQKKCNSYKVMKKLKKQFTSETTNASRNTQAATYLKRWLAGKNPCNVNMTLDERVPPGCNNQYTENRWEHKCLVFHCKLPNGAIGFNQKQG